MKLKGSDLIFISQIERDGTGVIKVTETYLEFMNNEIFELYHLSLSENTYIAINFNAFVVKIKDNLQITYK